uniref:Uncharacterized protein n=1 Tax=Neolamprologus brichardi TaxID=32507 RepID=A0A3Q4MYU2_NEOBR
CSGPEKETQDCQTPPCLGLCLKTRKKNTYDLCPWSPWSPCSQTCGAGSVSRHRACVCEQGGDAACPPEIEAERNRVETQLCYKQPCPGARTQNSPKTHPGTCLCSLSDCYYCPCCCFSVLQSLSRRQFAVRHERM